MAREIKFRFWDAYSKKMEYDHRYIPWPDEQVIVDAFFDTSDEHRESLWLEWTGIKDSQGVDIYEGDIVEREHFSSLHRFSVVFREGSCGFFLEDDAKELWGMVTPNPMKVIGNIYENPHLMED